MTFQAMSEKLPLHARLVHALASQPSGTEIWNSLSKAAPPPLDARMANKAIRGALQAFETALAYLELPNAKALALKSQLKLLLATLERVQANDDERDAESGLIRTLSGLPEWRALVEGGDLAMDGSAYQLVLGMELALAITDGKSIARAWSTALRRDKAELSMSPSELLVALFDKDEPYKAPWASRHKKNMAAFAAMFEGGEYKPPPPKTLNERIESQWRTKAAFASHAARTGIFDSRCLSESQFQLAMSKSSALEASRWNEYRVAIFFVGFCGLSAEMVAEIPIGLSASGSSVCYIELSKQGLLVRDYESLAYDTAKPQGVDGQPASLVFSMPLPADVLTYMRTRLAALPHASNLGALVPLLSDLKSNDPVYLSMDELVPSWARMRPTVGRILRLGGMDNFLVALLTGDFGHTAKSKLYYATVSTKEIWASAAKAYEMLGFEAHESQVADGMAFGSRVTPTAEQIKEANRILVVNVVNARPWRRVRLETLLQFHRAFTDLVAFRVMALLALRESPGVPMSVTCDGTVYLTEKSSAQRRGGLAAIVPPFLQEQIQLYLAHCSALLQRLPGVQKSAFANHLEGLTTSREQSVFSICSPRNLAQPVSTGDVLNVIAPDIRMAADFGRKFLENALRHRGLRTDDIDRVLRHEVLGQEANNGLADASEVAWVRRVQSHLNQIAIDLFDAPVHGLIRGLE